MKTNAHLNRDNLLRCVESYCRQEKKKKIAHPPADIGTIQCCLCIFSSKRRKNHIMNQVKSIATRHLFSFVFVNIQMHIDRALSASVFICSLQFVIRYRNSSIHIKYPVNFVLSITYMKLVSWNPTDDEPIRPN